MLDFRVLCGEGTENACTWQCPRLEKLDRVSHMFSTGQIKKGDCRGIRYDSPSLNEDIYM